MRIFLLIVLILTLLVLAIASLRVGGTVEYSEDGFLALARIGPVRLKVYPRPEKKKKKNKKKQEKQDTAGRLKKKKKTGKKAKKTGKKKQTDGKTEKKAASKGGGPLSRLEDYLSRFKDYLPLVAELLGELRRKLLVQELYLDYTLSGRADPANTAILYGQLCAGGDTITAVLENLFQIKKRRISVQVDFMAEQSLVYARLTLSYTIGQLVCIFARVGWKAFKIWRRQQKEQSVSEKSAS